MASPKKKTNNPILDSLSGNFPTLSQQGMFGPAQLMGIPAPPVNMQEAPSMLDRLRLLGNVAMQAPFAAQTNAIQAGRALNQKYGVQAGANAINGYIGQLSKEQLQGLVLPSASYGVPDMALDSDQMTKLNQNVIAPAGQAGTNYVASQYSVPNAVALGAYDTLGTAAKLLNPVARQALNTGVTGYIAAHALPEVYRGAKEGYNAYQEQNYPAMTQAVVNTGFNTLLAGGAGNEAFNGARGLVSRQLASRAAAAPPAPEPSEAPVPAPPGFRYRPGALGQLASMVMKPYVGSLFPHFAPDETGLAQALNAHFQDVPPQVDPGAAKMASDFATDFKADGQWGDALRDSLLNQNYSKMLNYAPVKGLDDATIQQRLAAPAPVMAPNFSRPTQMFSMPERVPFHGAAAGEESESMLPSIEILEDSVRNLAKNVGDTLFGAGASALPVGSPDEQHKTGFHPSLFQKNSVVPIYSPGIAGTF